MTLRGIIAGRFDIDRLAGKGGMGEVYRAWDRSGGAWVAVKVLHTRTTRSEMRFAREAELLSSFDHPGIVRFVDQGTTKDGEPYLAMEWLEGESLSERLARVKMGPKDVIQVAELTAWSLGAAHASGIVHRDLKPGNIFLVGGEYDRVKVLDFGIARLMEHGHTVTATGAMVGTAAYMAPEQARSSKHADARADVYAVGAVIFRCLTGRRMFEASSELDAVIAAATTTAPRLRSMRPDTPPELDELVARTLERDPAARPADGLALAAELGAVAERLGIDRKAARDAAAHSAAVRARPAALEAAPAGSEAPVATPRSTPAHAAALAHTEIAAPSSGGPAPPSTAETRDEGLLAATTPLEHARSPQAWGAAANVEVKSTRESGGAAVGSDAPTVESAGVRSPAAARLPHAASPPHTAPAQPTPAPYAASPPHMPPAQPTPVPYAASPPHMPPAQLTPVPHAALPAAFHPRAAPSPADPRVAAPPAVAPVATPPAPASRLRLVLGVVALVAIVAGIAVGAYMGTRLGTAPRHSAIETRLLGA